MLSADQSTGSEEPAASFPGAGSTACAPEGRMRSAHHLIAPGALVPCPGGHPLRCRCRRCRAHTVMQVSLWCASLLEGLEDTGQCEPGFSGGKGVGRRAAVGLSQTWRDCASTHSDLLVSHGAPPRTLTCWFPMVQLHAL